MPSLLSFLGLIVEIIANSPVCLKFYWRLVFEKIGCTVIRKSRKMLYVFTLEMIDI